MKIWKAWVLALRPKTLGASIAPVFIGTAMAYEDGNGHFISALASMLGGLMIQIGTNLSNDYYDFFKGADTEERLGPKRATQSGWIKPEAILIASTIFFGGAVLCGIYLVTRGGWPIVVIGLLSIVFGILYTGGPYPLAYLGLGDLFVLIFFGPIATSGTYYVQTLEISSEVLIAGLAPGLLSTSLLAVNNLRDLETDQKVGKKTLAVRFGSRFVRKQFAFCLITSLCFPLVLVFYCRSNWLSLMGLLAMIPAIPSLRCVIGGGVGEVLNHVLENIGKILVLFSLLFSVGWMFG